MRFSVPADILWRSKTIQQPGIPDNSALSFLSSRYDLSKVFGSGTIYTADPIKGEQAVMLYAVVTNRDAEIIGLTPMQKVSRLDLGAIMGANELTGYMNNQTSVSLAVKLYCTKMNIDPKYMRPSRTITIANGAEINSSLSIRSAGNRSKPVSLNNRRFDANGRTTSEACWMVARSWKEYRVEVEVGVVRSWRSDLSS